MINLRKPFVTTLILILAISTMSILVPQTFGAGQEVTTYAYISAEPNPIGVGQTATVLIWLNHAPPTAAGPKGDRWENLEVELTDPDGTVTMMGPYTSDDVGAAWFLFTPTKVGTYQMQLKFPGQTLTGVPGNENDPNVGDYYKPSTSRVFAFVVQQEEIPSIPDVSPPDYWSRPLYAENRELSYLASNWLMPGYDTTSRSFDSGSAVAVNNQAPDSAHILWTKPLYFGGLVGAEQPTVAFYQGLSYETMFTPPVIVAGRLYYNAPVAPRYGFFCVDLETGEEIFYNNLTKPYTRAPNEGGFFPGVVPINFAQILDYESPNQHGSVAYLWSTVGSDWSMFDAWTGNWILDIENVPSGTIAFGPHGEVMVYSIDATNNKLMAWNSTKAIPPPWDTGSGFWQWRPDLFRGETLDGNVGAEYTVSFTDKGNEAIREVHDGTIYVQAGDTWTGFDQITGAELFSATLNRPEYPSGLYRGGATTMTPYRIYNNVYAEFIRETMQWYGYDVKTGQLLWGPTTPYDNDWGYYNGYTARVAAYGYIYNAGYDGMVHAINAQTGNEDWTYFAGEAGFETVYGTWPFYGGLVIADDKVFAATGEHSPGTPLWKGEKLHVMDAHNGNPLWKISGWYQANSMVVADGKLLALNGYDNQIYCFGKGQTKTTVQAPQTGISAGSSIMITGTVTDLSPGQEGTPAISDADMSTWMEYLHMQKECPANAKGVQVTLTAMDANGAVTNLGTVTSDMSGMFQKAWAPNQNGQYTIIATFEGSNSYASSYAETAIVVGGAPNESPTQPEPTSPGTGQTEMYLIAVAAVIVIIAVIIAAVVMRRRK